MSFINSFLKNKALYFHQFLIFFYFDELQLSNNIDSRYFLIFEFHHVIIIIIILMSINHIHKTKIIFVMLILIISKYYHFVLHFKIFRNPDPNTGYSLSLCCIKVDEISECFIWPLLSLSLRYIPDVIHALIIRFLFTFFRVHFQSLQYLLMVL